jgi:hypothetical protein
VAAGARPLTVEDSRTPLGREGVGGSPNGLADPDAANAIVEAEDRRIAIVLSFGYPARRRDPESRSAAEWSAQAKREPLDELVERV